VFWSVPYGRGPGLVRWQTWVVLLATVIAPLVSLAIFEPGRLMVLARSPIAMMGQAQNLGVGGARVAAALLLVIPVVVLGLRRVWQDRRELSRGDIAIVMAAAITVIVLVAPKSKEHLRRFALMLPVPAVTILGFLLARRAVAGRSPWPGRVALAGAIAVAGLSLLNAGRLVTPAQIDPDAAEDLRAMREQVPEPASTLVISEHGLEWWSGYFLHTPVRMLSLDPKTYGSVRASVPPDAFQRYRRVLVVRHVPAPRADRALPPRSAPDASLRRIQTGRALELFEWHPQ
jgi:hypothetical protein